ncbi:MAG: ribosome small subunit-dependent GTPase A [Desulfobulbaceae bacterium]|nr:ribosome small subunit-dependent GTPase A [Desulfobulbaceae bacterium]
MTKFTLNALGWNDWFAAQSGHGGPADTLARVAAVDREQFLLVGEPGFFRAKLAGKYLFESRKNLQLPCVGDWVWVEKSLQDQFGLVHGILARRTCLRRKAAGDSVEYQMIAANVDFVIIVQSCHYDFNLKRLERYLVMVKDGGAIPIILLTKIDLVEPGVLAAQIEELRSAGITELVVTLSNVTQEGLDELKGMLTPGRTYCFVGSSGVGKSTIINALLGQVVLETKDVSGTGEGRHTTVRRELVLLENGALVIDNPGMREFGVMGAEAGIAASYADIMALAAQCQFGDCTHTSEPGCAVRDAVACGQLSADHYENYGKLRQESAYYEMSHFEKRKKDKDFGRFLKSAKKELKD